MKWMTWTTGILSLFSAVLSVLTAGLDVQLGRPGTAAFNLFLAALFTFLCWFKLRKEFPE